MIKVVTKLVNISMKGFIISYIIVSVSWIILLRIVIILFFTTRKLSSNAITVLPERVFANLSDLYSL